MSRHRGVAGRAAWKAVKQVGREAAREEARRRKRTSTSGGGTSNGRGERMNESDTRAKLIDPAMLAAGWTEDQIEREYRIRGQQLDYVLRVGGRIVAAVEAKRRGKPLDEAIGQARRYAALVNAYYAVATNGTAFVIVPMSTGKTEHRSSFPGPDVLGTPRTPTLSQVRTRICPQCGGKKVAAGTGLDCPTCQGYGLVHSLDLARPGWDIDYPGQLRPVPPTATATRYPPGWNICSVCTPYTHTPQRHAQRQGRVNHRPYWAPPPPRADKGPALTKGNLLLMVSLILMMLGLATAVLAGASSGP